MSGRLLIVASLLLFSICAVIGANSLTRRHDRGAQPGDDNEVDRAVQGASAGDPADPQARAGPGQAGDRTRLRRDDANDRWMRLRHTIRRCSTTSPPSMPTILRSVELRDIEAFYRQPVGQKLLEKTPALTQQSNQVGQDASRRAAEDLRIRLTEALRQKGPQIMMAGGSSASAGSLTGPGSRFPGFDRRLRLLRTRSHRRTGWGPSQPDPAAMRPRP